MKKTVFALSLCLLVSLPSLAQDAVSVDSLYQVYSEARGIQKPDCANDLIKALFDAGALDSAYRFTHRSSISLIEATVGSGMSAYEFDNNQYKKSIEYGLKAAETCAELKDSAMLSDCYSTVDCAYCMLGDFASAIIYNRKCIDIDSARGDDERLSSSLSNMATLYMMSNRPEEAYEFIKRSVSIERENDNPAKLAIRLGKLSEISLKLGKRDDALTAITEALELDRKGGREDKVAVRLSQMGDVYLDGKDWKKAEDCYQESLDHFENTGNKNSIAICLNQLGNLYARTGRLAESSSSYLKSLDICRELENDRMVQNNLHSLYGIYKESNPSKALEYLEEYVEVHDKIYGEQSRRQMDEFRVQYDTQQKENEIELFKLKEHRNRNVIIISALFIALCLIIMALLVILNALEKRHNKMLKRMDAMKDRFYSIISHDLKNPAIAQQMALKGLLASVGKYNDEEITEQCRLLAKSADSQSALLQELLLWTRLNTGKLQCVHADVSLESIVREAEGLLGEALNEKEITLENEIPAGMIVNADRMMLSTVIRNLLSNAVKFSNRGGKVIVSAVPKDGKVALKVRDFGVGMDSEKVADLFKLDKVESTEGTEGEEGSGLGLEVCKEITDKCGGKIEVESELGKGSTFTVTLDAGRKVQR